MSAIRSNLAIEEAALHCYGTCLKSGAPFTALGEFLDNLDFLEWEPCDIQEVANIVLPLIVSTDASTNLRLTTASLHRIQPGVLSL